jgi:hypothetical protein
MKKQTAVEFLGHELNVKLFYDISPELWEQVNEIFKQAKAMEKEQMMKTWTKAIDQTQERAWNVVRAYDDFDDYYNETYGGDK